MKSLTVDGTVDAFEAIANYVMLVASQARLDDKTAYKLRLAVDEIATNIIIHAYEGAGIEGKIVLNAQFDEQALTIFIEDTGAEYDPTQQAKPDDLDQPLENREIGGLGVYLALQSVDRFIYQRIGDRNLNILVVNIKTIN
ncbi:anti-sigma regulatory factor [Pleurocapsa sp. PCC 7319]|uniref:ATP-binding protein n=1 Tax=Pleurocapsa sp. PCC 7319 TaxID=118161 RepID=UPI000346A551|nr:anti-sigma regulatory factor [Pleurocapsa sp. PCC 7319]